jgi:hypothetical protein
MFYKQVDGGVNSLSDLPQGSYKCVASEYYNHSAEVSVTMLEYALVTSDVVTAVDLIITTRDKVSYLTDFIRLPDYSWRDSFGNVGNELSDVFPPELLSSVRLGSVDIDVVLEV